MGEDKFTVRVTNFVGNIAVLTPVLGADPHRIALYVTVPNDAGAFVVGATDWPAGTARFVVTQTGPLLVEYHKTGPLVSGRWAAVNVPNGVAIDFVEILLVAR